VLSLPSLHKIAYQPISITEKFTLRNNLRKELKELTSKANLRTQVSQLACILGRLVWKTPPFTCKQVYDLLNGTTLRESRLAKVDSDAKEGAGRNDDHGQDKVVRLIQTLKQTQKTDSNEYFRDWLKRIAAKGLEDARSQARSSEQTVAELLKKSEIKWVINWLWAAESFPYPLRLSYMTYLYAGPERHQEFEQKLWPVLLETMCGEVSKITCTHSPFNRCKQFVITRSQELANDVYDREALTRMMAGFYRGLRLGLGVALLTLILSTVSWACKQLGVFEGWLNPYLQGMGYVIFISFFSLLFNRSLLIKVVDDFRRLRISESNAVFTSYLIALSLNSKQA